MSNKKFSNSFSGKGYYIALILCAVAIGISGYLYYYNANRVNSTPEGLDATVSATLPGQEQVIEALATQPSNQGATTPTTVTTPQIIQKPMQTVSPLAGETIAEYAMNCLSYNPTTRDWRVHNGIDIAAEAGAAVCAAADGVVATVYTDETMGTTVVINHSNDYVTCYASLNADVSVKVGDSVKMGQTIGTVGNTALLESAVGSHLHFSVACGDTIIDPSEFLKLS